MEVVNTIALSVATLTNLLLGILILYRNKDSIINRIFALLIFSIVGWTSSLLILIYFPSIVFGKLAFAFASILPTSFFHFSFIFPSKSKKNAKSIIIAYLSSLLFIILAFTPYLSENINVSSGYITGSTGKAFPFFVAFLFIFIIWGLINFFKKFRKTDGVKKTQIRYLFFGILLVAIIALTTNIILPLLNIYNLNIIGPSFSIILTGLVTYSILKHRLMDIKLVILRTITYSLVVLFTSAAVVSLTLLLPERLDVNTATKTVIAIIVSIFIVLILGPLKRFIAKFTDRIFFKAKVDYQQLLTELSDIINREIDLDVLLYALSRRLESRIKVKNVSVYLAGTTGGAFYRRKDMVTKEGKKKGLGLLEPNDEEQKNNLDDRITHNNPLLKYLLKRKEVIVLEALERKIEDTQDERDRKELEASKKALDELDGAVIAPIMVGDNLNAVMVLGPKLSGDPYGSEDLDLLQLVGPQLASALEKSRLYEEARQFTERLKKEVALATEDLRNTNLQLQEQNRFLSAMQKITNIITRTLDFRKVTQSITDSIATELGYLGGVLLFLGKDKNKLFPDAVTRSKMTDEVLKLLPKPITEYHGDFKTDSTRSIKAIKLSKVQIGTDFSEFISPPIPKAAAEAIQKKLRIKTIIAVPIYSEEGIVGVIDFLIDKDPGALKDTDLSMMKALCNQTGIVYRNIELYRQIQDSNKQLEEANKHLQKLDQAKSEFVSITSHQLRTPMTGIMGYLSMILQGDFGKVPKEQKKILDGLLEESQRMIRIINLFLNVSKIESGRMELNIAEVQFEEVIEKVYTMVKQSAEDKKVKLVFKKPAKPLPLVNADKDKLGDIVLNLIDNAIKYTEKGSVTIEAKPEKKFIHFSVKDTGRGIDPEEAKRLFTKFVRGYGIAQVNPDGSGLGLYVARRLAEAHHGDIWVESKGLGKGSTFSVKIPIVKSTKKVK